MVILYVRSRRDITLGVLYNVHVRVHVCTQTCIILTHIHTHTHSLQIPAVKQFGIFMGLIVLMCFVQVFVYMPFVLHFWHCHILPCENSIFQCLYRVFCLYCLRPRPDFSTFPAVRYRDLEDDDSGIDILEQGNGSTDSENSSTASGGSGTSESDSNLAVSESNSKPINGDAKSEDQDRLLEMQPLQDEQPLDTSTCVNQDDDNNPIRTVERKVTVLVQTFLLQYLARPVMVLRLWKPKRFSKRQWALISFGLVWLLYLGVKGIAVSRTCFLQLTDRPPQFFNPDSNIQKMLDLTGNLTESSIGGKLYLHIHFCWSTPGQRVVSCWSARSYW